MEETRPVWAITKKRKSGYVSDERSIRAHVAKLGPRLRRRYTRIGIHIPYIVE